MTETTPGEVPGQEPMFELPLSPGSPPPPVRPVRSPYATSIHRTPGRGPERHRFHAEGSVTDSAICGNVHGVSPLRQDVRDVPDCEPCVVAMYAEMAVALDALDTPTSHRLSAALRQAAVRATDDGEATS